MFTKMAANNISAGKYFLGKQNPRDLYQFYTQSPYIRGIFSHEHFTKKQISTD